MPNCGSVRPKSVLLRKVSQVCQLPCAVNPANSPRTTATAVSTSPRRGSSDWR